VPSSRFTGGPLNVKLYPQPSRVNGVELVASALQTWFEAGSMNVTVNVVTQMGRRAQEELIKRTEGAVRAGLNGPLEEASYRKMVQTNGGVIS
jgi:hypothetical protein